MVSQTPPKACVRETVTIEDCVKQDPIIAIDLGRNSPFLPPRQLDSDFRLTRAPAWREDCPERVASGLELGFRKPLGVTVVEDALDPGAELLDVLDQEEGVCHQLVARLRLVLAEEVLDGHALGKLAGVPDLQPVIKGEQGAGAPRCITSPRPGLRRQGA